MGAGSLRGWHLAESLHLHLRREALFKVRRPAFTLIELLIVIALIALLLAILLPALHLAKAKARDILCLSNLEQLQTCAILYSMDYDGFLPPNRHVYNIGTGGPSDGWNDSMTWCAGLAPHDTTTENIERALLFPYNRSTGIYHCPADMSKVKTQDGQLLSMRRTRSYNLSQSINGYPYDIPSRYPPSFAKEHEIDDPTPANLLFFVGVHEDGILDSHFGIPPRGPRYRRQRPQWWDLPAGRHSQGGCFSFADGHVERWRWAKPKIFIELGQLVGQDGEIEDFQRVQRGVRPEKPAKQGFIPF
jgi:prepilin-type N-terminal cleavage/methylation domain-containing protein/prepilin-type processing-associated H-X9-DG protein